MLKAEQMKEEDSLRNLFRRHSVSLETTSAVYAVMIRKSYTKSQTDVKDIQIFHNLPEELQQKLLQEIYTPRLTVHPLFAMLSTINYIFVKNFAAKAVQQHETMVKDKIFSRQDAIDDVII